MLRVSRGEWFVRAALVAGALALAPAADAGERPVKLERVTANGPEARKLEPAFRDAVITELGRVDLSGVDSRERFLLSASLVKMQTQADRDQTSVSCQVKATLRRQRGGALHAVLSGRARVEDGPERQRAAELLAMQAAVRSAIRRVPEALRRERAGD